MTGAIRKLFFDPSHAFDHSVTVVITLVLVLLLAVTPLMIWAMSKSGRVNDSLYSELMLRYKSWLVLTPLIIVPILLGPGWTILANGLLSLFCYREFARSTGLFREKTISMLVALSIVLVTFAALDHWYRMFVALAPLTVGVIAMAAIIRDEPQGYIQRVALGFFGFALFGSCMGHLSYLANDLNYRPILILIFVCVELNDIFAYMVGKSIGRRKLAPNTSPKKTIAGSVGAVVLTTSLTVVVGRFVFAGTVLAAPIHLVIMGLLVSISGQFGDLMLSSIKRDLGIKDMAATIPGHGGLLDRFDSIILVGPILFHYINYFVGIGLDRAPHVLTWGGIA